MSAVWRHFISAEDDCTPRDGRHRNRRGGRQRKATCNKRAQQIRDNLTACPYIQRAHRWLIPVVRRHFIPAKDARNPRGLCLRCHLSTCLQDLRSTAMFYRYRNRRAQRQPKATHNKRAQQIHDNLSACPYIQQARRWAAAGCVAALHFCGRCLQPVQRAASQSV